MENYQKNAENNLVELCRKKDKAQKDLLKFVLIWIAVIILLTPIHFAINYYYPENNGTIMVQLSRQKSEIFIMN